MQRIGTVCFIVENKRVLLAHIQYPDGKLLWNGIGGFAEPDESPRQAVIREFGEETRIRIEKESVADVLVIALPELELHVFVAQQWSGAIEAIDPTIKELRWFDQSKVPYVDMHHDNILWLPQILGKYN